MLLLRIIIAALAMGFSAGVFAQDTWLTRFEDEIKAYEAQDAINPPPKGATVVVGSSTIRLWTTIKTDLAPLVIIPRGFGGSTARELDYYLERIVLKYAPSSVVIYEGDNDLNSGKSPQFVLDLFKKIVGRIHARYPKARVYIISIKPSIARWDQWPKARETNALLKQFCANDSRRHYIDTASALLGSDGRPKASYFVKDQIHLSVEGYERWTGAVRPVLLKYETPSDPAEKVAPKPPSQLRIEE